MDQKIMMCIKTYINLYGTMPSIVEMSNWTGASYDVIEPIYKTATVK